MPARSWCRSACRCYPATRPTCSPRACSSTSTTCSSTPSRAIAAPPTPRPLGKRPSAAQALLLSPRMRVLITGITGFAGSHLAEHILAEHPGVAVYGTYRWRSRMENLEELARRKLLDVVEGRYSTGAELRDVAAHKGRVQLLHCDLTDAGSVEKLVAAVPPHRAFHLAAQSFVQSSFDEPAATIRNNVESQLNLLEAVRRHDNETRVHVAGSSEEYGLVLPDEVPMKETNPLRPLSPYAVSKVAQDKLAWQYFKSYGMHVVVTRGFNHTGPRRGTIFVTSSFARQIAEMEAGC